MHRDRHDPGGAGRRCIWSFRVSRTHLEFVIVFLAFLVVLGVFTLVAWAAAADHVPTWVEDGLGEKR